MLYFRHQRQYPGVMRPTNTYKQNLFAAGVHGTLRTPWRVSGTKSLKANPYELLKTAKMPENRLK